jgi:hypothetical protein
MERLTYKTRAVFNGKHVCLFIAFVAGGTEEESEKGIYQCECGCRWETAEIE